jgi:SAM-dependent methyltransferase
MPAAREETRPLGVVYTPREVSRPMVTLMLGGLVRRTASEILDLRVLDPSIGTGAFLLEVTRVLATALLEAWTREPTVAPSDRATWPQESMRRVISTCVVGIDINRDVIEDVRRSLRETYDVSPQLRVGDALELDWTAEFPEIFARGGFDVVIGNPPYIRQEWLAGKPALTKFASYDGVADLYIYFIEQAHRLLRAGGRFCLIVPNKWMTAAYGRALRRHLAAHHAIDGIVDFSRSQLFAEVDAFPCIVWGSAAQKPASRIFAERAETDEAVNEVLDRAATGTGSIERPRWGAEPWHIDRPSERALLDRLESTLPPLGEIVRERPSRGVVTGCNRAFVIDRATRERILAEEPAAAELIRPFIKGRDIRCWLPVHAERWILLVDRRTSLDALPVVRAHLAQFREALEPKPAGWTDAWPGRKPGAYAWHELQDPVGPLVKARAPRLLYQDIQTTPACALDRDGSVVPDTTVWILPSDDRFLLAVLNSPLYAWYARRRFPPALNGAVRPKGPYMRTLPIAAPPKALRDEITTLVDRRLELELLIRAEDRDAVQDAADHDTAIARRIFDAYGIATAERRMIESG